MWTAIYTSGEYGLRHSGWYRDPSGHPLETLALGLADMPVWGFSQFALNLGEACVLLDAWLVRAISAVLLLPIVIWLAPSLRSSRLARFFALGMVLSLAPLFTTHPQGRLLLAPSFGALGWLACALDSHTQSSRALPRIGARVMRSLHLWLAPVLFVLMLGSLIGIERGTRELAALLTKDGGREGVLINTPIELIGEVAWQVRAEAGAPALTSLHQLYSGDSEVVVERVDDRTLDVAVSSGWGRVPLSRLFAREDEMPKLGTSRSVRNFVATVLDVTPGGLPSRVRFAFATPLESDGRQWFRWRGASPESFALPAIGAPVTLPAVSPLDLRAIPKQKK